MAAPRPQELVERASRLAACDGCVAVATRTATANLRWANGTLTTNGVAGGVRLTVVALRGSAVGVASCDGAGAGDVEPVVRRAEAVAVPASDVEPLVAGRSASDDWDEDVAGTSIHGVCGNVLACALRCCEVLRTALPALVAAVALAAAAPAPAAQPLPVSFHAYTSSRDFDSGTYEGARLAKGGGALVYGSSAGTLTYSDAYGSPARAYSYARWTSPSFAPGFGFTELVASWNAHTPAGTWIQVDMQGLTDRATWTKWYTMGRWASAAGDIRRNSVGGQGDADGYIAIDTFFAKDHPLSAYRLRVTLYKLPSAATGPTVRSVGAVASDMPNAKPYAPSPLGGAEGIELPVPRYSQEIHAGEYPEFDGGGEAWCSPTSTSMIVAYWDRGPAPADYAYVLQDYPNVVDPWVDFAAARTYDYHYQGAGNWPFNTAYAATFGLEAEVTQLRSLNEAEQFVKAGIPLVASIAFEPNKLDGFLFRGTDGHLLTIVGFTAAGDVISNDPASTSDSTVRHVYDRTQFERAWLTATGGIVYVIHPASVPLPPPAVPSQPNW